MDRKTKIIFNILLYSILVFSAIFMMLVNSNASILNRLIMFFLLIIIFISLTFRHAVIYQKQYYKLYGLLTLAFELILISCMSFFDKSPIHIIYFIEIIADAVLFYNLISSITFTAVSYIFYASFRIILHINLNLEQPFFYNLLLITFFCYIFIFSIMYVSKYQINQRLIMMQILNQLEVKTSELESANRKLKKTSEVIEEMTVLKERNRIAREIHDTVGHTLTTVLIELEACKRLIPKNPDLSLEKLEMSQTQVRNGLNNIRQSVKTLHAGEEMLDFVPSIEALINDTQKHTGVSIVFDISKLPSLTKLEEKLFYRALLEGLTNGIKHGNSTKFILNLKYEDNKIVFSLLNNGHTQNNIKLGFGLTSMRDRVQELGGTFSINTNLGFELFIAIPHIIINKEG